MVPHNTRIEEEGQLCARADVVMEGAVGCLIVAVLQILRHDPGNIVKLVTGVAGKVDVVPGPAHHPGDEAEELVHQILLPRHCHNQVFALVLRGVEEDLDGLLAVIAFVCCVAEVLRCVDQFHPTHRFLDHLLGLGGRVVDPTEVVAVDEDNVIEAGSCPRATARG